MERFTLFDIQREVAVAARGQAFFRQAIVLLIFIVNYYFPERLAISFYMSINSFAVVGSLLIFISIFDITASYFRGFRNKKKQIEILEMRIDKIDTLIENRYKQTLFNNPDIFICFEQRSKELKEILEKLK